jgi:hypothetical protein
MGRSAPQELQRRRILRAERKREKAILSEDELHCHQTNSGLFLCDKRCSETSRYCTCVFLTEAHRDKHVREDKCSFPKGIKSADKLALLASQAGGSLAFNQCPNWQEGLGPQRPVQALEVGAPRAEEAKAYGGFHRRAPYHKP